MEYPQIRYTNGNGITLAYQDTASPQFPLLLINGFASPMDTWNPLFLAALSEQFRIIMFDNRGTGYTSDAPAPYSISLFAEDAIALMDSLGISRAHILGLSMGASIAQELVLAHPDRVDQLVLVAGTCGGNEGLRMAPDVWTRLSDKAGEPPDIAARMFSVLFPEDWLASHDPWKYCPEVHETTPLANAARQAEAFFGWAGSYDRLPQIRCPTLVITGEADVVIPPENALILAGRIPGASLVRFASAGHGLQYQCPEEFAEIVLEFLQFFFKENRHAPS